MISIHLAYASLLFFFFTATATTEIYTLSLHDALPILCACTPMPSTTRPAWTRPTTRSISRSCWGWRSDVRSEEHTSELQSQSNLVCRLLLEKKKKNINIVINHTHKLQL